MPQGESGEICIKGPQVMPGYWNRPEETAEVFVDGFFRTGDVGYIDEDGFVFIVDRIKDMINASGFKIYPRSIEEAILAHDAVAEVTVIGIADDYRGEAPKAFVRLKPGRRQPLRTFSPISSRGCQRSRCRLPSSFATSCPRR
jgi:long-chain acyl-CoA synthetase